MNDLGVEEEKDLTFDYLVQIVDEFNEKFFKSFGDDFPGMIVSGSVYCKSISFCDFPIWSSEEDLELRYMNEADEYIESMRNFLIRTMQRFSASLCRAMEKINR